MIGVDREKYVPGIFSDTRGGLIHTRAWITLNSKPERVSYLSFILLA
jgi:hypothetical protein